MDTRRNFLSKVTLASAALTQSPSVHSQIDESTKNAPAQSEREYWVSMLTRVTEPVLANLAANQLKARMPAEGPKGAERRNVTHLEALGRTLGGVSAWLNSPTEGPEEIQRQRLAELARTGLANALDPAAADYMSFTAGAQNLVDAAFLALGLARARTELWEKSTEAVQARLVAAFQSTRKFKAPQNNWLLFAAMVEAFLASVGAEWRQDLVEAAFSAHEAWYKGDGAYGDGAQFHWDYYNSFVIHPLLIEVLERLAPVTDRWAPLRDKILARGRRFAAVQERLIAPDGSFPPLGRSLTYRCGAFHQLALMALRRELPAELSPPQAREGLGGVIRRTLGAPETFDEAGWLRIGLAGHQPLLAENYITTGSLYLCTFAFLPLGLKKADPFWAAPPQDWTSKKAWAGKDIPADHAL